jgi:hypothetical protein
MSISMERKFGALAGLGPSYPHIRCMSRAMSNVLPGGLDPSAKTVETVKMLGAPHFGGFGGGVGERESG